MARQVQLVSSRIEALNPPTSEAQAAEETVEEIFTSLRTEKRLDIVAICLTVGVRDVVKELVDTGLRQLPVINNQQREMERLVLGVSDPFTYCPARACMHPTQ